MVEPVMTPEAAARIDDYTNKMARRSHLGFAQADDARKELASHIEELAIITAKSSGVKEIRVVHVLDAIRSIGDDNAVVQAFFAASTDTMGPRRILSNLLRLWKPVVLGLMVTYIAVHALVMFLMQIIPGDLLVNLAFMTVVSLMCATLAGLRLGWLTLALGIVVFVTAVLTWQSDPEKPWLWWTMPATASAVCGLFLLTLYRRSPRPPMAARPEIKSARTAR